MDNFVLNVHANFWQKIPFFKDFIAIFLKILKPLYFKDFLIFSKNIMNFIRAHKLEENMKRWTKSTRTDIYGLVHLKISKPSVGVYVFATWN